MREAESESPTFGEWLAQRRQLPDGFRQWRGARQMYQDGWPIWFAIAYFKGVVEHKKFKHRRPTAPSISLATNDDGQIGLDDRF